MSSDCVTRVIDSSPEEVTASAGRRPDNILRVAFYGRTNGIGQDAFLALGRQFRECLRAVQGQAVFVRYFYDLPALVDAPLVSAVHDAGGPPCRHGGWTDLEQALSTSDRGFDAIGCSDFDRVGRRMALGIQREQHAAAQGAPIVYADEPWPPSLTTTSATHRFLHHCRIGITHHRHPLNHSPGASDGT